MLRNRVHISFLEVLISFAYFKLRFENFDILQIVLKIIKSGSGAQSG